MWKHRWNATKRRSENAPEVYGLDRGCFGEENIEVCEQRGVALVQYPAARGMKTAERESHERNPAFKEGQRFRAGIEGASAYCSAVGG